MSYVFSLRQRIQDLIEYTLLSNNVTCNNLTVNKKPTNKSNDDFVVPNGCHSSVDQTILKPIREDLCRKLQSSGIPVSKVTGDKWNSFCIHLNRKECFRAVVSSVLDRGRQYGQCSPNLPVHVLLSAAQPHSKNTAGNDDIVSLEWIRLQVIQQHLHQLLLAHGYTVTSMALDANVKLYQELLKQLCIDPDQSFWMEKDQSVSQNIIDKLQLHSHVTKIDWESRGSSDSRGTSPKPLVWREGDTALSRRLSDGRPTQCRLAVFDMKKYIQDNKLPVGKCNFDQNLTVCNVTTSDKPSNICQHVAVLDSTVQDTGARVCVHVVGQSQSLQQQKVHLMLQAALESETTDFKQYHMVCGPVIPRKDGLGEEMISASQYVSLRYQQMHEASVLKYGDAVTGAGWENTLQSLTSACIKFELLCTVARNTVKVSLSETDLDSGGELTAGGSFVMYNCARLATLFGHFQEAVDRGTYPPLPAIGDIDWSTLREEQEWSLLFDYVYVFPEVVQQSLQDLTPAQSIHTKAHTHKVCQFLCGLSRSLSSFYSRYHVLGEPRSHLLPAMFARLYLLKAVHQVMTNGLALLAIQPPSQL